MGLPAESSRGKGREIAIETLIDMDPSGAAYRASRTMNNALFSSLHGRFNRIPDSSLFEAAKALAVNEIPASSPEVIGDLYHDTVAEASCDADTNADKEIGPDAESKSETPRNSLKSGWEERVLRHHEKIIRAKNNANPRPKTVATSSAFSSSDAKPQQQSSSSRTAVPPPQLVTALRQIFGSASSPDLQDLILNKGGKNAEVVSVLPSLLQVVLNHEAFTGMGTSSSSPPSSSSCLAQSSLTLKRDLKSIFESTTTLDVRQNEGAKAGEGLGASGGHDSVDVASMALQLDKRPIDEENSEAADKSISPLAANVEAIIGNVCREILNKKTGSENSHVHGLLIAVLSVLTSCLISEDDLEGGYLQLGEVKDSQLPHVPPAFETSVDSTDHSTHLLQVGAMLSVLRNNSGRKIHGLSEEVEDFFLNDKLLDYFAEASSTYEEQIDIQKASLLSHAHTPYEAAASKTKGKSDVFTPNENAAEGEFDTLDNSLPALISASGEMEGRLANDIANATSILLGNIANLVAEDDVLGSDDGNDDAEDEDDEDSEDERHEEGDENQSFSQSEPDGTEQSNNEENGESATENDEMQDDVNNEIDESENNGEQDEETMMLQRALALSLAASISAGASNSSNSDDVDNLARTDTVTPSNCDKDTESTGSDDKTVEKTPNHSANKTREESKTCAINLPPLPKSPPLSLLPNSSLHDITVSESAEQEHATDEAKLNLGSDSSSIFDPAALSSFGNLPASHVLVHLLNTVLGLMQTQVELSSENADTTTKAAEDNGGTGSLFFTPTTSLSSTAKPDSLDEEGGLQMVENDCQKGFAPDSVTSSLLIASLHLSNYLRDSSIAVLRDILSGIKEKDSNVADDSDGINQSIQIANSTESEDPFSEKDNPASGAATAEYLEAKGLKRKAAAAAHIATLRQATKQKLVKVWKQRVTLYSLCCYLNMRCLRIFMGKFSQNGLRCSDVPSLEKDGIICLSTKSRAGLSSILSSFHSVSASITFQNLQDSMDHFCMDDIATTDQLDKNFLIVPLCNESLLLWGASTPLFYSDHKSRVELLHELLQSGVSPSDTNTNLLPSIETQIKSCSWNDTEVLSCKLDILCWRLRTSDMLDCFVAQPMLSVENNSENTQDHHQSPSLSTDRKRGIPDNSMDTISLLASVVEKHQPHLLTGCKVPCEDTNLAKLYLALCQRAIHNLILWNDLSLSSNDENDHDVSGGGVSMSQSGSWGEGALRLVSNPSSFHFDSTKCSDSIAIVSSGSNGGGSTANQRAAKVWGTVLSTTCFLPKSGVHRWAVKLDKCERGHVFVGVATARASVKTYVGGDKNGWGVIGTQALWHDRIKIRGDYGSTFRTGAIVVATLDTNVGTLSFGLWKDATSGPDGATGPLSPTQSMNLMTSPRRNSVPGGGGALIEDWGIAFEGLPLDVKLFPAVGLYQRDDRATLYTISNSATASCGKESIPPVVSSGTFYFPPTENDKELDSGYFSTVRSWNRALCADGVSFATETLIRSIKLLSSGSPQSLQSSVLLTRVLPSLASSICLIPSCIPSLSAKYAMELLPLVTRCAKLLDNMILPENRDSSLGVEMKEGSWAIRADLSTSYEGDSQSCVNFSEYLVQLRSKAIGGMETVNSFLSGNGVSKIGRSSNDNVSVTVATCGTHVQFVEEWDTADSAKSDTPTVIVDARISLDGTKLEGIYYNAKEGSSGHVSGYLQSPLSKSTRGMNCLTQDQESLPDSARAHQKTLIQTETLLCLAVGHLALMLCSQTALADIDRNDNSDDTAGVRAKDTFQALLQSSRILSRGRLDCDGNSIRRTIDSVWERCRAVETGDYGGGSDVVEQWQDLVYFDLFAASDASSIGNSNDVKESNAIIQQHSMSITRAEGSFSRLCSAEYQASRIKIAAVILYHTSGNDLKSIMEASTKPHCVMHAWRASLQVMENGIREALMCSHVGIGRKEACLKRCQLSDSISEFLFEFPVFSDTNQSPQHIADEVALIFNSTHTAQDLDYMRNQTNIRTHKSIMRYVGLRSLLLLLGSEDSFEGIKVKVAIESAMISLPRLLRQSAAPPMSTEHRHIPNQDSNNHFLSVIAGCTPSVQDCIVSSVHSLYSLIGSMLGSAVNQEIESIDIGMVSISSFVLGLLANYFTTFHPSDYKATLLNIFPTLGRIISLCRNAALHSCDESSSSVTKRLCSALHRHSLRRVLQTTASFTLTACAQISKHEESQESLHLVELLSDLFLQELSKTIAAAEDSFKQNKESKEVEAVHSDWEEYKKFQGSESRSGKELSINADLSTSGLTSLIEHVALLSMKSNTTPSPEFVPSDSLPACRYLNQLLNTFHVIVQSQSFLNSINKRPSEWTHSLFSAIGVRLPIEDQTEKSMGGDAPHTLSLRCRLRILRLLRPFLLSIKANSAVVHQLLNISGTMGHVFASGVDSSDKSTVFQCMDDVQFSHDNLGLAGGAVSLLRYLYAFSSADSVSWRSVLHQVISDVWRHCKLAPAPSPKLCGIFSFLGGAPGCLRNGSFVIIEPDVASSLSSSSSSGSSGKSRGSSSGTSSSVNNSAGSGLEGIVSGLCRDSALAGILSGVDSRSGICEVVTTECFRSQLWLPPSLPNKVSPSGRGMTIRAVRVSSAELTAADELPLFLDNHLPAGEIFSSLVDIMKCMTTPIKAGSIKSNLNASGNENRDSSTSESMETDAPRDPEKSCEHPVTSDLLTCAMGLRSCTVLISGPEILKLFVSAKSNKLQPFLAQALQLASLKTHAKSTKVPDGLSSLPSYEARVWHLLSVRSSVESRKCKLEDESLARLKKMFEQDEADHVNDVPPVTPKAGGFRTPSSASGSFCGTSPERSSQNTTSNTNRLEEEEHVATGQTTGQNQVANSASSERQEEDDNASDTAAAHLREAAIAQMAELGLPRQWAELALRRTGGTNIEAAVHFCLERGGDMERLLAEEHERRGSGTTLPSSRRRGFGASSRSDASNLIRQLVEMGFPRHWCAEALAASRNNVDEALTWILTNGERLSAEDEGAEEEEEEEEDDEDREEGDREEEEEDEDSTVERDSQEPGEGLNSSSSATVSTEGKTAAANNSPNSAIGWSGSICPIRFVSGRSNIDPSTLEVTGLPNGGFSSVGTKGVLLTSGKWYYEAEIKTAGCLQIGWADSSFVGHCQADRGDGCGDGPSSWAFDGWRRYRWHSTATEWGCRWSEGDIVGCLVDMDSMKVNFTLNGKGEEIGMGLAFSEEGFRPCSGVYACVSFNRREKMRLILGGQGTEPFKFPPPEGYRGVGEAILDAVKVRDILLEEEKVLLETSSPSCENLESTPSSLDKRYICDFSDGEHGHELFAWQHRYYGSDASVHLGASRSNLRGFVGSSQKPSKNGSDSPKNDSPISADITCRLIKIFERLKSSPKPDEKSKTSESCVHFLKNAYTQLLSSIDDELKEICATLCILYARKLVMHMIISHGHQFTLGSFLPDPIETPVTPCAVTEDGISRSLWQVLEYCTSLQSSGWVGEAGAMAVAAEALGLGISSFDHNLSNSAPPGMYSSNYDNDQVLIPCGGVTQFLSSAVLPKPIAAENAIMSTALTFAACSEAAVGSDAGGSLAFVRSGLQSAVAKSNSFRRVILAAVRKAVRLLAVIEYASEEGSAEDDDSDLIAPSSERKHSDNDKSSENAPDARLASFLTGLLMSEPVRKQLSVHDNLALRSSLFEGWCIGLLSASSPWRMVCALTAAGILNSCPMALYHATSRVSVISEYIGRLESTVSRRVWAERAATPVCSRYSQAMIELLSSVKRSLRLCPDAAESFISNGTKVDAATPLPFIPSCIQGETTTLPKCECWEWNEGWVSSNLGWEIWTGTVEIMEVEWKPPPPCSVRTLMDGGDGPPLLREGCLVMRGPDWESRPGADNEDGKDLYEQDKVSKVTEKHATDGDARKSPQPECDEEKEGSEVATDFDSSDPSPEAHTPEGLPKPSLDAVAESTANQVENEPIVDSSPSKKKKKKAAGTKLPLGTVLSIEPWNGIPGVARRVRWNLTGKEGVYRYGGDGGHFDIIHVEANEKGSRVKKRHPNPESAEQCASRYGFGRRRICNVLLRLRCCPLRGLDSNDTDLECDGVLEWPDFGAGIQVECTFHTDGAISITEKKVLYGSKDSGWEARFGQPSFVPGTVLVISPTQASMESHYDKKLSAYDELLGSDSFLVKNLRNREDGGGRLRVTSEMRLFRSKKGKIVNNEEVNNLDPPLASTSSQPPPICFDSDFHAPSISLSKDKRTVTCTTSDGRGTVFGNVGFTKGVHYWEVKLEKAEIGSVFIGVAEKPGSPSGSSQGSSYGFESQPRLNRWLGWGFVNFRATYTAGAERVYGAHCHAGDTVGVLLDCDAGRISYFFDGVLYGEHILNDLGCAFENVSPFGFNADGCGSGGAGQGAPSGIDGGRSGRYPSNGAVRPRALWPVIGLRHPGDRVTMSSKWMTSHGVDGVTVLKNALAVDEILCMYEKENQPQPNVREISDSKSESLLPRWFVEESFLEYTRWKSGRWLRSSTRGSGPYRLSSFGLDIDLDTSPFANASACAAIGLPVALLPGDKVDVKRSAGRILELQEEAVVLGTYQGRLFYRLVSQKSEGGSLMEGGGRAWFWDESEAVEGGLQIIGEGQGFSVELPKLNRFKPLNGGLKVVYLGGAVVRSDLEIFEGSANIGKIPHGTIIPPENVIERRLNSCGVVRYLIDHEPVGRGWISSRIRGGKEELIVEMLPCPTDDVAKAEPEFMTPEDSAKIWYKNYLHAVQTTDSSSNSQIVSERKLFMDSFNVERIDDFAELLASGRINGLSDLDSDSLVASAYGQISDVLPLSDEIECSFFDCALVMTNASMPSTQEQATMVGLCSSIDAIAYEVASELLLPVIDDLPSTKALMARISMLRALNRRARLGLPWLSLRPAQEGSAIFGGLAGFGTSLERAGRTWESKSKSMWAQVPSISSRLRNCREIFFTGVKRSFMDSVMDTTATPTPLSHDEYELPREVRTVRVNRLKARRAMSSDDSTLKRKHSVFSQLQREMRGWSGATLRRGFIAKGHGGQKRAFKVKLVGEGVNDYSGPYREVFTDAMQEITDLDPSGNSSLGVLEPTANNQADVGDGRDLFVFAQVSSHQSTFDENPDELKGMLSGEEQNLLNSFSSLTNKKNESSRDVEEALVYFGKLVGTACRHGIPVDLPLPLGVVWKLLVEELVDPVDCLKEIDILAFKRMKEGELDKETSSRFGTILSKQRSMLNSFAEGMSSVLPVELLSVFSGEQLRGILCGNPDIDVELLRRVVEYDGYNENDNVISYFWEVLREMTTSERKLFLQFVWARNRLPLKESDFDAPFKILKDTKCVSPDGDYPLPSASTCFFSLTLPEYPQKHILKKKLIFAIENVTTMESDHVTNDVEVSEGWRGL